MKEKRKVKSAQKDFQKEATTDQKQKVPLGSKSDVLLKKKKK